VFESVLEQKKVKIYRVYVFVEYYAVSLFRPAWLNVETIRQMVLRRHSDPLGWWLEYMGPEYVQALGFTKEQIEQFEEAVRQSEAYQELYQEYYEDFLHNLTAEEARIMAADIIIGLLLYLGASVVAIIAERGMQVEADATTIFGDIIAGLRGLSWATIVAGGLMVVAALATITLIANPTEFGTRRTEYLDEYYIMVYGDIAWEADHVGTNRYGEFVYTQGVELAGVIDRIERGVWVGYDVKRDRVWFVPVSGLREEIGWLYWVSTPVMMEVEYLGFVENIGGGYWRTQRREPADPEKAVKVAWTKPPEKWFDPETKVTKTPKKKGV